MYEKKDFDMCPRLVYAETDVSTMDVFKEFDFQVSQTFWFVCLVNWIFDNSHVYESLQSDISKLNVLQALNFDSKVIRAKNGLIKSQEKVNETFLFDSAQGRQQLRRVYQKPHCIKIFGNIFREYVYSF